MSYPWNGAKFLTSDQNLRSYGQETDFYDLGHKTFTKKSQILRWPLQISRKFLEIVFNTTSEYTYYDTLDKNFPLKSIV